jgi:hypothetical protein
LINYQRSGANEGWGQHIDTAKWAQTLREVINRLRQRHNVVFLCHDQNEARLAEELDSTVTRVAPRTMKEYAEILSQAAGGLCNRIHACISMASVGLPVVSVGADSRTKTLSEVGLPTFYVKDVTADLLEARVEEALKNRAQEKERLKTKHADTLKRYVALLQKAAQN